MSNEQKGRRLNWRQACAVLGCSKSYFYKIIREGRLSAYRMRGARKGLWVYEKDCTEIMEKMKESDYS